MASVQIYEDRPIKTKLIESDFSIKSSITATPNISVVRSVLPFRIKFTAIRIEGAGPNSFVPIPLQVIGFSNYIL